MKTDQHFEKLMGDYGDALFRLCFLYLKDYQLAEDAVQETFLKAMKSYERFEHKSSEKTWLTRIAINCCKNIMRTHWFRMIKKDFGEEHVRTSGNSIEDLLERNSISGAIMQLSSADRELILLYYYQELAVKDIAAILGIQENTANQRLHRARKKLKKVLAEEGYGYGA